MSIGMIHLERGAVAAMMARVEGPGSGAWFTDGSSGAGDETCAWGAWIACGAASGLATTTGSDAAETLMFILDNISRQSARTSDTLACRFALSF